jgi:DNA helicase IV
MPKKAMYIAESTIDDEARTILNKKIDHSHLVVGCAGSGKSCLALLRIKMLSGIDDASPYYLITVVRSLVEYLRRELKDNKLPSENIVTYKEWKNGVLNGWCAKHFETGAKNFQLNKEPNYLLVDECQDLPLDDIQDMRKRTKKAIFLYGDDEQQIMDFTNRRPASIKEISEVLDIPIYRLRYNYRLPKKAASFAQEISGDPDLERHCKNSDGNMPYMMSIPIHHRVSTIISLVDQNRYDDVGIICRTDEQVRAVYHQLLSKTTDVSARYSIGDRDYKYLRHETKFKVMNIHQAKGQQFEAVFLLIEDNSQYDQKMLYVGATRTYYDLFIIYDTILPEPLRAIPLSLFRSSLSQTTQPLVQV